MIPRLFPAGKSFKGTAAYLLHDPDKAQTTERVRWTHTLNLASDYPPSAVDEMLWTARGAEWLKQQANVPGGGRKLENPVKHFSLNWHPSETPTREQMIEAAEAFLAHMGWHEHQALLVRHDDKHPHVHVMLNAVHPETGRSLDASFEKRRAQEWAFRYERQHGMIFCEERLKPKEEREASPTRQAWQSMKASEREHERAEYQRIRSTFDYFARNDGDKGDGSEWKILKQQQRDERLAFFTDGKQAYREVRNAVFREVREDFRDQWRDYYAAKRDGVGAERLLEMKGLVLAAQKYVLDERRTEACAALREQRDQNYNELLARHREERAELRERQTDGQRSPQLLNATNRPDQRQQFSSPSDGLAKNARAETSASFRKTARELCEPTPGQGTREPGIGPTPAGERARVRDGLDAVGGMGLGVLGAIATIGERLFDGFFGGGEAQADGPGTTRRSATLSDEHEDITSSPTGPQHAENEAEEAKRLQAFWDERKHRKRERD
jgi:hypothetical protein